MYDPLLLENSFFEARLPVLSRMRLILFFVGVFFIVMCFYSVMLLYFGFYCLDGFCHYNVDLFYRVCAWFFLVCLVMYLLYVFDVTFRVWSG